MQKALPLAAALALMGTSLYAKTRVDLSVSLTTSSLFAVHATVDDPLNQTLGLQSIGVDVVGSDGVQIVASSVWAPAWTEANLPAFLFFNKGFYIDRSDGTAGSAIHASQPIVNQLSPVNAAHNSIIEGVGKCAVDETNGDFTAGHCTYPAKIADGDYFGAGVFEVVPDLTRTMLLPAALPGATTSGEIFSPSLPDEVWGHLLVMPGAAVQREVVSYENLTVQGSLQLASDDDTFASIVGKLDLGSTGQIDLTDQPLIIDYAGASPRDQIRSLVAAGRLASSLADPQARIGIVDTADLPVAEFVGNSVDGTSILVRLTTPGDANLDGTVSFDDLLQLAQGYGRAETRWSYGDFNADGVVNFDDLLVLAQNYEVPVDTLVVPTQLQADWQRALAIVPEPGVVSVALMVASRRRRVS